MWPFAQEKLEPLAEPVDRVEETQNRMRQLKPQLDELDKEMRRFKAKNHLLTDAFDRILHAQSATITGMPAIEKKWGELLGRRDRLIPQWRDAQKAAARLKFPLLEL